MRAPWPYRSKDSCKDVCPRDSMDFYDYYHCIMYRFISPARLQDSLPLLMWGARKWKWKWRCELSEETRNTSKGERKPTVGKSRYHATQSTQKRRSRELSLLFSMSLRAGGMNKAAVSCVKPGRSRQRSGARCRMPLPPPLVCIAPLHPPLPSTFVACHSSKRSSHFRVVCSFPISQCTAEGDAMYQWQRPATHMPRTHTRSATSSTSGVSSRLVEFFLEERMRPSVHVLRCWLHSDGAGGRRVRERSPDKFDVGRGRPNACAHPVSDRLLCHLLHHVLKRSGNLDLVSVEERARQLWVVRCVLPCACVAGGAREPRKAWEVRGGSAPV